MKFSSSAALVLSLLIALVVVFVIDPLDRSTLSTPFCLGLILMGLSFRQSPWVVVTASLIYMGLTVYAMLHFLEFSPTPSPHPIFWFFQRFGLFFIVCMMSMYLSSYRDYTERNLAHIQLIFGKLPAPVLVSDVAGYIIYVNKPLCTFLGQPASSLLGKRYIDLFMTNIQERKAMRYYIELFGDKVNTAHEVELTTATAHLKINACLIGLGVGVHRNMITVMQPN